MFLSDFSQHRLTVQSQSCHTQEWATKCHQLINDAHHWIKQLSGKHYPTPCIFGDLEGVIPDGSYEPSDCFMKKFYSIDAADVCVKQYCHAHSGDCPLLSKDSDLEVAGLPCWDFSIAGKRRMEEGPTNTAFITHAKRMVEKEVPLVLIENTKDHFFGPGKKVCYDMFMWLELCVMMKCVVNCFAPITKPTILKRSHDIFFLQGLCNFNLSASV